MPLWEAPSDHPANPPATLQGHTSLPGCQEEPGRDPQSGLPQITSKSSSVAEGSLPSWSSGPAGAKLNASHEGIGSLSDENGDSKVATQRVGSAMDTVLRKHLRWAGTRAGPVAAAGATRLTSGRGRNLATGRNHSAVTWHNQTGL